MNTKNILIVSTAVAVGILLYVLLKSDPQLKPDLGSAFYGLVGVALGIGATLWLKK